MCDSRVSDLDINKCDYKLSCVCEVVVCECYWMNVLSWKYWKSFAALSRRETELTQVGNQSSCSSPNQEFGFKFI